MHVPVSVVITILDEERSIVPLLHALREQSYPPQEVILVDGGSTDDTRQMIADFQSEFSNFPVNVLLAPGTNRSQARNKGIKAAKSEVIAVTDAGCIPKPSWLAELTQPFSHDHQAEVVAGFYDPQPANPWENAIANFTCTRSWRFDAEHYLPSSRSIAFTKKTWQKVGGYPEELETCEDLVFAEKLKASSTKWYVNKKAQVVWPQPKSLHELREKIFHYALGDLEAGYERHIKKIHAAIWRIIVLLGIALPMLFVSWRWVQLMGIGFLMLYVGGTWWKHRRVLRHPFAFVYTVILQLMVDSALVQAFLYHHLHKTVK